MAGHKPFHNVLITLYTPLMNMIPNAEVWLSLLRPMLLQWYRTSDFTADRAGLLACQDINVALKTMVKMSGVPKKFYDNIRPEIFLKQAIEFEHKNRGVADGIVQNLSINTACAPWMVVRAAKLFQWYKGGSYTEIINNHALWFRHRYTYEIQRPVHHAQYQCSIKIELTIHQQIRLSKQWGYPLAKVFVLLIISNWKDSVKKIELITTICYREKMVGTIEKFALDY